MHYNWVASKVHAASTFYLIYYSYLIFCMSSIFQTAVTTRFSGKNRYFIVIICIYRIVRNRIRNGYHGNTLHVENYTLTCKVSLPVRWILLLFPARYFHGSNSYSVSNNSICANNNNKIPFLPGNLVVTAVCQAMGS